MPKISLPIMYYSPSMLARRWECSVDEIDHLVEIHALKTVPMLAAYSGCQDVVLIPFPDENEARKVSYGSRFDGYEHCVIIPAVPEGSETLEQAIDRTRNWIDSRSYLKQVITAEEVARFEALILEQNSQHVIQSISKRSLSSYLTTKAMANSFDGLNGWNRRQWKTNLGDPAGWMKPAMISGGGPPNPNRWNPVELAKVLMLRNKADPDELNRRFNSFPELQSWLVDWKPFAEHLENN